MTTSNANDVRARFRVRLGEALAMNGVDNLTRWSELHGYYGRQVHKYRNGASVPSIETLARLSGDLGVSAGWLLGLEE